MSTSIDEAALDRAVDGVRQGLSLTLAARRAGVRPATLPQRRPDELLALFRARPRRPLGTPGFDRCPDCVGSKAKAAVRCDPCDTVLRLERARAAALARADPLYLAHARPDQYDTCRCGRRKRRRRPSCPACAARRGDHPRCPTCSARVARHVRCGGNNVASEAIPVEACGVLVGPGHRVPGVYRVRIDYADALLLCPECCTRIAQSGRRLRILGGPYARGSVPAQRVAYALSVAQFEAALARVAACGNQSRVAREFGVSRGVLLARDPEAMSAAVAAYRAARKTCACGRAKGTARAGCAACYRGRGRGDAAYAHPAHLARGDASGWTRCPKCAVATISAAEPACQRCLPLAQRTSRRALVALRRAHSA